jgi:FSR family fosmidomycin resistance protein-like MFS transporter
MMAVSRVSGTRKGLGTAFFVTGGNLGFALGPMVGSFLVLGFGLRATLALLAPGLVIALAILFFSGNLLKRESSSRAAASVETQDKASGSLFYLILVCLIVTLRSWVYISFITYLPMFLQGRGVEIGKASLMLTVFLAAGAAAGLYGGHLSDRIGRTKVIIVSMLLYPLFMSIAILSREPWTWLFIGASGASLLASFSVTIVLGQELLPKYLGLVSGLLLGLGFGMGGLGVAVSGWIADIIGLYKTVWILALVPVLGSVLAAFIRTPGRNARSALKA